MYIMLSDPQPGQLKIHLGALMCKDLPVHGGSCVCISRVTSCDFGVSTFDVCNVYVFNQSQPWQNVF